MWEAVRVMPTRQANPRTERPEIQQSQFTEFGHNGTHQLTICWKIEWQGNVSLRDSRCNERSRTKLVTYRESGESMTSVLRVRWEWNLSVFYQLIKESDNRRKCEPAWQSCQQEKTNQSTYRDAGHSMTLFLHVRCGLLWKGMLWCCVSVVCLFLWALRRNPL